MAGVNRNGRALPRSPLGGRGVWASRSLLTLLFAAASLSAPGIASAAPLTVARAAPFTVTGSVDCVMPGTGGAFTAILGYDNTLGYNLPLPDGRLNALTPSQCSGAQPTTFAPCVHHGVFSARVTTTAATSWPLGWPTAITATSAPTGPPPTQMPANGNGTGVVIGLGIAGGLGVVMVRRLQRRLVANGAATGSSSSARTIVLEARNA